MQCSGTTAAGLSMCGNRVSEDKARTKFRVRHQQYLDNISVRLAKVNPTRPALWS